MTEFERVTAALADGTILPAVDSVPNTLDTVRALFSLSGVSAFADTDHVRAMRDAIGPCDHIILVVLDGLGLGHHASFPPGGFLSRWYVSELRAVFPSTTSVALTSFATGAWPAEHGITGWWTYFREVSRTIAPLTFVERETAIPAEKLGLSLESLIPIRSAYPSLFRRCRSFVPRAIATGEYPRWSRGETEIQPYRSPKHAIRSIVRYLSRAKSATFTYLYSDTIDTLSHKSGWNSAAVSASIRKHDEALATLRARTSDAVRIVVLADHGLVNVPPHNRRVIRDGDPMMRYFSVPPSGDARAPIFHVTPGRESEFKTHFLSTRHAESFALLTPHEAQELKLFGPVPLSNSMRLHLGSFIGIALEPITLEYVADGKKPKDHISSHGGMSPDEMRVGLFIG